MATTTQLTASKHPIKSVTVFKSSKAEVVRVFNSLSLQQGRNTIEINGLPSSIDSQSIRVSGLGDGRLLDVICTIGTPKSEAHAPSTSGETLRTLEVEKEALESEKRVREHEADLLVTYAKTLNGEHVAPMQMTQFLGTFVEHGQKNLEAVRAIGEKIVEVDRLIAGEKNKTESKKGAARGQATIIVGSEAKAIINLKLTYIVGNAQWRPAYELHATTENGKPSPTVTLHYLARITQSTGEDWTDVALTLSTVTSDTSAKSIPKLFPVKITPRYKSAFGPRAPGSLFGPHQQQHQSQVERPSLFGPRATGSLFGEPQQQQPQSSAFGSGPGFVPSSGLFGASQQQPQSSAFGSGPGFVPSSGLFGASQQQPQSSAFSGSGPVPSSGLFSASQQQPQSSAFPGSGLFGASQQQQSSAFGSTSGAVTGSGLFGASQQQPQSSAFGSTSGAVTGSQLFGASQQQPQPPSVPVTPSLFGQKPVLGAFGQPSSSLAGQELPASAPTATFGAFGQLSSSFLASQQLPASAPTATFGAFGQHSTSFLASHQHSTPASGGGLGLFGGGSSSAGGFGLFGNSSSTANRQNPAPASSGGFGFFGSRPRGSIFGAQSVEEEGFEEVSAPGEAEAEPKTIVTETPVAISYTVHGGSTIPSDGIEHQATVAVLQFESTISHITIPRVDPRVYLQCNVKNTSEYRLLPGFVSVILDDGYVSKTCIQAVNPGDTFNCTLGDDVSAKVTYSRIPTVVRATGGAFSELFTTTAYTTHITIHNKHPFVIPDLRIRDVIPTCEDKRIKVILVTPEGLADAKEGQDVSVKDGLVVRWQKEKEGMFEWRWKVESGEKVTIEAKWEARAPADLAWTDSVVSSGAL